MIVLVDDSNDDRDILAAALATADPDVPTLGFDSGAAAIEYLGSNGNAAGATAATARLVLLDLKMPRLDGLQVLRSIRGAPVTAGLPVVMCTSSREPYDIRSCYLAGANGYVCKPVDFARLTEQMRAVIAFWIHTNERWR